MQLTAVDQNQLIIREPAALADGASGTSAVIDMDESESFGLSLFAERDVADADVDVELQHSFNPGGPWRTVAEFNLAVTAAAPEATEDSIYGVTRRYYRLHWANSSGQNIQTFEAGFLRKPMS